MGLTKASFPLGKYSYIAEYKEALDAERCESLVSNLLEDFLNVGFFTQGPTIGGVNTSIKRCMDTGLMDPNIYTVDSTKYYHQYAAASEYLYSRIWSCINDYIQTFPQFWSVPNLDITGLRIQRYFKNDGFYREHVDGLPWDYPRPDGNRKNHTRVLAVLVYLNTVTDGGGTSFRIHDCSIDAEIGKIVLFPTSWTHPHMGLVPYSSDKWIISCFVTTNLDFEENTDDTPVNTIDHEVFEEPKTKFTWTEAQSKDLRDDSEQ